MRHCRCEVERCVRCVCVRENQRCDGNCLCFPERSSNRRFEEFLDAQEEAGLEQEGMDPDIVNAAFTALVAK